MATLENPANPPSEDQSLKEKKEKKENKRKIRAEDSHKVPDHAAFYISNVLAEYEATIGPHGPSELHDQESTTAFAIARTIREKEQPWTWADLYALEIAIARLQTPERLRRRICVLREKYRRLFGEVAYEKYLKCTETDSAQTSLPALRAEMETLLREFHWHYSATSTRDEIFHELRRNLVAPLLLYGVIVVGFTWYQVLEGNHIPSLMIVILAGMAGAFASILRRVQLAQARPAPTSDDAVSNLTALGLGQLSVYLALASGAIFPVVLLLMFVGGILQGSLFPEMHTPLEAEEGLNFLDFSWDTGPATGVDFAKLLVWSFVSGFAERFVPDVLDKITTRGTQAADGEKGATGS